MLPQKLCHTPIRPLQHLLVFFVLKTLPIRVLAVSLPVVCLCVHAQQNASYYSARCELLQHLLRILAWAGVQLVLQEHAHGSLDINAIALVQRPRRQVILAIADLFIEEVGLGGEVSVEEVTNARLAVLRDDGSAFRRLLDHGLHVRVRV